MGLLRNEVQDLTAVLWSDAVLYVLWKKDPRGPHSGPEALPGRRLPFFQNAKVLQRY
jgi:hypothetical protein